MQKDLRKNERSRCLSSLTGGTLYKEGERKDIDILIYFKRQNAPKETFALKKDFEELGLYDMKFPTGYVTKAKYKEINVDILNPETSDCSDYDESAINETTNKENEKQFDF